VGTAEEAEWLRRTEARTRDYPLAVTKSKYIAARDQACMVTSVDFFRFFSSVEHLN
jgi:hypothetical protein